MDGKTCKRGHLIAGDNEVVYKDSRWGKLYSRCRKCTVLRSRERREKAKAARPAKEHHEHKLEDHDAERARALRISELIARKAREVGAPWWVKEEIEKELAELRAMKTGA